MQTAQHEDRGDVEVAEELARQKRIIEEEIHKVIVGQDRIIDELLIALFAKGHCLLVGVPGLAKTLLISTLADVLDLSFNRVQFTPDLMPADIIGTDILEDDPVTQRRAFTFLRGPLFCNMLLADEINRTPPKTQAALLQAMQEYRVTAGGKTYALAPPFFVLATQNPIEQEGTYPLPEAQLDRFMFNISIDYPDQAEEVRIVAQTTSAYRAELQKILHADGILRLQDLVRRVPASDHVIGYAVRLAQLTRPTHPDAPEYVRKWVNWGAGPRASQYLILGAKTRAVLYGRLSASVDDVRALAPSVLRHRILTNFSAEAEGISSSQIIGKLLQDLAPETIGEPHARVSA